jgi:alcohol dehydrogenase class IV
LKFALLKEDILIAVGGGSPIDNAKVIKEAYTNEKIKGLNTNERPF